MEMGLPWDLKILMPRTFVPRPYRVTNNNEWTQWMVQPGQSGLGTLLLPAASTMGWKIHHTRRGGTLERRKTSQPLLLRQNVQVAFPWAWAGIHPLSNIASSSAHSANQWAWLSEPVPLFHSMILVRSMGFSSSTVCQIARSWSGRRCNGSSYHIVDRACLVVPRSWQFGFPVGDCMDIYPRFHCEGWNTFGLPGL